MIAREAEQRRRLQAAYIECRAGEQASREMRLAAAFDLYARELMTRREICDEFGLDAWGFADLRERRSQSTDI